jgi:hypothetical protein
MFYVILPRLDNLSCGLIRPLDLSLRVINNHKWKWKRFLGGKAVLPRESCTRGSI